MESIVFHADSGHYFDENIKIQLPFVFMASFVGLIRGIPPLQ